jgi:hypothetical protein
MHVIEWKDKKNWTTPLTAQYRTTRHTRMVKISKCRLIPFFSVFTETSFPSAVFFFSKILHTPPRSRSEARALS